MACLIENYGCRGKLIVGPSLYGCVAAFFDFLKTHASVRCYCIFERYSKPLKNQSQGCPRRIFNRRTPRERRSGAGKGEILLRQVFRLRARLQRARWGTGRRTGAGKGNSETWKGVVGLHKV